MENSNPHSHRTSRSKNLLPFLLLPALLLAVVGTVAFRTPSTPTIPVGTPSSPLILPAGWQAPPVPADNPITSAKFVLGRYLFYEIELSANGKTSCSSCHDRVFSFAADSGSHSGAFGVQGEPARMVPRLMNVAYDTILTWDGHIQTLEDQVAIAVQKPGDLGFQNGQTDTNLVFQNLASNPVYPILFQQAFGDANITLDRISKAIATFERCIISGNSAYDLFLNGDSSQMSSSAIRGANLFFDTTETNCSECHNNLGARGNMAGNIFTDNNYYRTGTFESTVPGVPNGGYGLDTLPNDTNIRLDAGRAAVTGDTANIGKFRTPSLRNVALHGPYGADGTVASLQQVIANYNMGGNNTTDGGITFTSKIPNKDPRIKPLNLTSDQMNDLAAFLHSLTDLSFTSNPAYQDPGSPSASVDDYTISNNLSLYPNPSTGPVNIECPDFTGSVDLALISSNGATVWQKTVNSDGRLQLDFSSVVNGSYRLRLRSGSTQQIVPVVLSR